MDGIIDRILKFNGRIYFLRAKNAYITYSLLAPAYKHRDLRFGIYAGESIYAGVYRL